MNINRPVFFFMLIICAFLTAIGYVCAAADNVSFDVLYKGQPDVLVLTHHSLRAADFTVKVWSTDHYEVFAVAPSSTYRGFLQEHPEITVLARVSDLGLEETAVVRYDGVVNWFIEPIGNMSESFEQAQKIVYQITEAQPEPEEYSCGVCQDCYEATGPMSPTGVAEMFDLQEAVSSGPMQENSTADCGLVKCQIGLDADFAYCHKYGNDVQAIVDRLEWMIEQVDVVYTRDLLVTFEISGMMIRNTLYYDPAGSVLGDFTSEWSNAKSMNNQDYPQFDIAHLLTERDTPGIAGLAYVGWSCNGGYGWSKDWAPIIAHEIGHNWGGGHCVDPVEAPYLNNHQCGGGGMWIAELNKDTAMWYKQNNAACLEPIASYDTPLPPYAHTDRASISKSQLYIQKELVFDVLSNDHDANCEELMLFDFDLHSTQGGTVRRSLGTGVDGRDELIYSGPVDFVGNDMFSYKVADPTGRLGIGLGERQRVFITGNSYPLRI